MSSIASAFVLAASLALLVFYLWQLNSNEGKALRIHELLLGAVLSFFLPLFGAYHSVEIRKALFISVCWFLIHCGFKFLHALFKRFNERQKEAAHSNSHKGGDHNKEIKSLIDWLRR